MAAPPKKIRSQTSMHTVPGTTQAHLSSVSEGVGTKSTRNLAKYVPLYHAALKGDWRKAKEFFSLHPEAITAKITKGWERVLHIAAGAKQIIFVEELVKSMDPLDLALKNKYENTALCFAVASGITKIAELMVAKDHYLPMIRGSKGVTPLHMAALLGYRDMVWYLSSVTDSQSLTEEDYVGLLIATISSDLYDVALRILEHKPELAIKRDPNGETALHVLARKPSAFSGKSELGIWQRCVYRCVSAKLWNKSGRTSTFRLLNRYKSHYKHLPSILMIEFSLLVTLGIQGVIEKKIMQSQALELVECLWKQVIFLLDDSEIAKLLRSPSRPLFIAAEFGNFQFIRELILSYPDLIWKVDEQSRSIFHIAVIHRQEKIFKLLYDIGAHKDLITSYKNTNNGNMLHLAANLAPSNRLKIVSGAALQMQRELLWFKEVEKNMQPLYMEMKDSEGRTPQMLFTQEHKGLVESGEKWMKDTGSSCMLVATLITTVMFAAIFTVPGGNNSNTGTPMFLKDKSFIIFPISDALALFSSATSILMFLSILTSRYAEGDFLESLPKRLIIGLTTLFFSIASMLLAFSASFFIVVGHQLAWIIILIALTACVPVTLFAFLQFPLLADVMHSTNGSGIFSMERNERLY
ncbi:ankyrin repeat-containing protein ITN1-like isoform X2 [Olea europaea var. sylvestris]|uniref:ankyrin repeat-containing protein ITN1-like isoform X2 n=1 Tax=Olea europaea var. sylvestris TaxID=158386 RepID=UPI000C1CF4B5|nr:ankyrin repeat-containing protein ITN1-like isoform X2 [Olea europaea var. sylvestris]